MDALQKTFGDYPEQEIHALLGENAAKVYGFDVEKLRPIADRIGPSLGEIRGESG
jgi:hypothetical protein